MCTVKKLACQHVKLWNLRGPLYLQTSDDYIDQKLIKYADFRIIYEFTSHNQRNLADGLCGFQRVDMRVFLAVCRSNFVYAEGTFIFVGWEQNNEETTFPKNTI